ncbi:MAG: hypothetical protein AB7L66_20065 [Gemmatimonadales bacterium]
MAGDLTDPWLTAQLADAPAALAARTREFVAAAGGDVSATGLAGAARLALAAAVEAAVEAPPDRRGALDLLAADALVTLALAKRTEEAPEDLGPFAASLRAAEGAR